MATALNGRARLIPLVQRISFGSRLTFGWIRRRRLRESNATRYQDYVGQASRRYRLALGVMERREALQDLSLGCQAQELVPTAPSAVSAADLDEIQPPSYGAIYPPHFEDDFSHSTVTLLARLRGLSTSQPRCTAR